MDWYDITILALNAVLAFVLTKVGSTVMAHRPDSSGRLAATSFAAWWFALAALQLGSVLDIAISNSVGWTLAGFTAYFQAILLAIVLALGALVYYLVYLYTGRRGAWKLVAAAYILYYLAILYWLALAEPMGVTEGTTGSELEYRYDLSAWWFSQVLGLALLVPPLLGAAAYFSLFFRVPTRSQKFRIASIAGAIIIWFGISLVVGQFTDWDTTRTWRVVSSLITLSAAMVVFWAFDPPAWLRRRVGIKGFGER